MSSMQRNKLLNGNIIHYFMGHLYEYKQHVELNEVVAVTYVSMDGRVFDIHENIFDFLPEQVRSYAFEVYVG